MNRTEQIRLQVYRQAALVPTDPREWHWEVVMRDPTKQVRLEGAAPDRATALQRAWDQVNSFHVEGEGAASQ